MARKQNGKQGFSVDLPPTEIEVWDAYVERARLVKWGAVSGAFRLMRLIPPHHRHVFVEGDDDSVRQFWEKIDYALAHLRAAGGLQESPPAPPKTATGGKAKRA